MREIFKNKFIELYFDDEYAFFKMIWLASTEDMTDQDFKECLLEYVSYYYLKPKGVLHNMKNNQYTVAPEMQDWANENVNRRALEVGLNKVAFVISDDIFALVSVQQAMDEKEGKELTSVFFAEETEALAWLKK